jgi:hypothetical protein
VAEDEWRVEVELEAEHEGNALGDRLRTHDLDDEARERLGRGVIVTKDGPHVFVYATNEPNAREAERVVRELLTADDRAAMVSVTRWHPDEEAWKDASIPLPTTEAERAAERARLEESEEREAALEGSYDWEVHVDLPERGDAVALERELFGQGLDVHRRWKYIVVGAPTEERANELAAELGDRLPDEASLWVQPNPDDLPGGARFAFFGPW